VFRTVGDQPSLWESSLPTELARVDALLDDSVFFAPFARHFDPLIGRPSTPAFAGRGGSALTALISCGREATECQLRPALSRVAVAGERALHAH
jgi:hypothetical protein